MITRWLTMAFCVWTLSGAVLIFQGAGQQPWWDPVWVLLLAASAYAGLVAASSLGAARITSLAVMAGFGALLVVNLVTAWPFGALKFTDHVGPRIGGSFPVLIPVLAFAILGASHRAASLLLPSAGRSAAAGASAGLFTLTVANSLTFLGRDRLWWIWDPWGLLSGPAAAIVAIVALGATGFGLAFLFPAERGLRLRWNHAATVLTAANVLFLVAHLRRILPP